MRKFMIAFCLALVALTVILISVHAWDGSGRVRWGGDTPIICKAASVYTDGTVIERPCPVDVASEDGLRMTLPEPGHFYRPLVMPDPEPR